MPTQRTSPTQSGNLDDALADLYDAEMQAAAEWEAEMQAAAEWEAEMQAAAEWEAEMQAAAEWVCTPYPELEFSRAQQTNRGEVDEARYSGQSCISG